MSFSLVGLVGYVIAVGLTLIAAGVVFRKGSHPICRKCAFDLEGLLAGECPECGGSLTARRAVAIGTRRIGFIRVGTILLMLSLLSFGYLLIDSPAMDRHKPLWMLDAELRLIGTPRQERVQEELQRRLFSGKLNPSERYQIYDIIEDRILTLNASSYLQSLYYFGVMRGTVFGEDADRVVAAYLRGWSSMQSDQRDESHTWLAMMIEQRGADWEDMELLIAAGHRLIDLNLAGGNYSQNSKEISGISWILRSWRMSLEEITDLTDSKLLTILGDHCRATSLEVRPTISFGASNLPVDIHYQYVGLSFPPQGIGMAYLTRMARLSLSIEEVRIDGTIIPQTMIESNLFGAPPSFYGSGTPYSKKVLLAIKDLDAGVHTVEIDFVTEIMRIHSNAHPDRVISQNKHTLTGLFEVRPLGEADMTHLEPGIDHVPTEQELCEYIRISMNRCG